MSELVTMYPAQANSPETSLSGALTAAGTTVSAISIFINAKRRRQNGRGKKKD